MDILVTCKNKDIRRISQVRDVNFHALYLLVFAAVIILKVKKLHLSIHFTE